MHTFHIVIEGFALSMITELRADFAREWGDIIEERGQQSGTDVGDL